VTTTPEQLLHDTFGLTEFRPGQERVIDALQTSKAALAVFPTGGGKSLCYQLPALMFEGLTVVVSPLIALMKDQIDALKKRGVSAARLDSTLTSEERQMVDAQMAAGTLKLLYVAPERFNNERFVGSLTRTQIALFAVDEAHCISEWGHNFRPDYLKLADTARSLNVERVLALTATATPSVVRDICTAFQIPQEAAVVTGFYRQNLSVSLAPVTAAERDAKLLKRLGTRKPGPTIVYVTLQKTAEQVAARLRDAGFTAQAYHAGMKDDERSRVQDEWMASDSGIVVATIAFGMGIDKANVRYVYHYNLPKSLESYSQEIGRAGRDDQPSVVEMLACPDDVPTLENFAYGDTPTEGALRRLIDELLSLGPEFDVSLYELADRHDLRHLVLRTAMTYLELGGVLHQGTPFYAGYEMRPLTPLPQIVAQFPGPHGQLVADLFAHAKFGRIWYSLNPDAAAMALGEERRRIVRVLEVLEERGLIEMRVADVRNRYTRLRPEEDAAALAAELTARFHKRESGEMARLQQVLDLVTLDACQTNALVGYFGQKRDAPCGHCTWCKTGHAQSFPAAEPQPPLPAGLDVAAFTALRQTHPKALAEPRQSARFLCGLSSPALIRARLTRHPLCGTWEHRRFAEVLAWCERTAES
jgi:ATP-dependent DNA helicase RecQ